MWYFIVLLFVTTPATDGVEVVVKLPTLETCQAAQELQRPLPEIPE